MILSDTDKSISEPPGKTASSATVYFVKMKDGEPDLVGVERRFDNRGTIEAAVKSLLVGPTPNEAASGFGSEIPRGTVLLGVHQAAEGVEVDLSRRFASGGGISSIETRLSQIASTLKSVAPEHDVYLNVEGKRLSMIGGEGIEVKQPINK